jgi:hypothetical protein
MQERAIEAALVKYAKDNGWFTRKVQWVGRNGAPDRLLAKDGRWFFIELKQKGKKPTVQQALEHERMIAAGIEVYVCDSLRSVIDVLEL